MSEPTLSKLEALCAFFEDLRPDDLGRFADFYAADAYFKNPFNELRGLAAITQVFAHMFKSVGTPRLSTP